MKKWQESRNYRQVKNDAGEIISYIITVDGIDVEVPEDVMASISPMKSPQGVTLHGSAQPSTPASSP